MFNRLKRLYDSGRITDDNLRTAVEPNEWITPDQFEEITGKPYAHEEYAAAE